MTASMFMEMSKKGEKVIVNGNNGRKEVEDMMSLESELAKISKEIGTYYRSDYSSHNRDNFGGGNSALASSFAAAAALDGSFCVVPSDDFMFRNFESRESIRQQVDVRKQRGGSPVQSQGGGNGRSVAKLLGTLKTLTEENEKLMKENEALRRQKVEADEAKEFVKNFKKEYEGERGKGGKTVFRKSKFN